MADISSPKELPIRLIGSIDPNDLAIIVNKLNELIVTVRTMNINHVSDMEKLQERISDLE